MRRITVIAAFLLAPLLISGCRGVAWQCAQVAMRPGDNHISLVFRVSLPGLFIVCELGYPEWHHAGSFCFPVESKNLFKGIRV